MTHALICEKAAPLPIRSWKKCMYLSLFKFNWVTLSVRQPSKSCIKKLNSKLSPGILDHWSHLIINTTWVCEPNWIAAAGPCYGSWGACGAAEESSGMSFEGIHRGTSLGIHGASKTIEMEPGRDRPPQSFHRMPHSINLFFSGLTKSLVSDCAAPSVLTGSPICPSQSSNFLSEETMRQL